MCDVQWQWRVCFIFLPKIPNWEYKKKIKLKEVLRKRKERERKREIKKTIESI